MFTDRRFGMFNVQVQHINDSLYRGAIVEMMKRVFIVTATHDLVTDSITYIGISDMFDEVPQNEQIPIYELTYNRFTNGDVEISARCTTGTPLDRLNGGIR